MCAIPAAPAGHHSVRGLRPLNPDYHRRLRKRLYDNPQALVSLHERGLIDETIEYFRLGLSLPYTSRKSGISQSDALVYPVRGLDGTFHGKYGYYNIPGITVGPEAEKSWAHGETRASYAEALTQQVKLLICEGAEELWLTWQAIKDSQLATEILLATTTHGAALPVEWQEQEFWSRWETIYCAYNASRANETRASMLAELSGKEIFRVLIPDETSADWVEFWKAATLESFTQLLDESSIVQPKGSGEVRFGGHGFGYFSYNPINLNGAFLNGYLYYPVQILRRVPEFSKARPDEQPAREVERLETVVIRSDRSLHTAVRTPAPRGTSSNSRVLRLTDNTLIDRAPEPNRFATWSWPSIKDYLEGRSRPRALGKILHDVKRYIKSNVLLPFEEDYAILTLTIPLIYAQAIFNYVPLLFVSGQPGTGESRLARVMLRLSANPYVCRKKSTAGMAEDIDEARGLTVIDSLEMFRRGIDAEEFINALMLSYSKADARYYPVHRRPIRSEPLNLYGVKLIISRESYGGTINGTAINLRMMKLPESLRQRVLSLPQMEEARLDRLRDELHTWTFDHVDSIVSIYEKVYEQDGDLFQKVTAPLKAMASLSGDLALQNELEVALGRQIQKPLEYEDPKALLRSALRSLILQGYQMVSVTHVVLELRRLLSEAAGPSFLSEMPEWVKPAWVAKSLRKLSLIDSGKSKRMRVRGANLRFYEIHPSYLNEVRSDLSHTLQIRRSDEFCQECSSCVFRSVACPIMLRESRNKI